MRSGENQRHIRENSKLPYSLVKHLVHFTIHILENYTTLKDYLFTFHSRFILNSKLQYLLLLNI